MKTFSVGDTFFGRSHADLINTVLGTNFSYTKKSTVELSDFQCDGVLAWFVYMDGSIHGYEDWRWVNRLSLDETKITERYVDSPREKLGIARLQNSYNPFRLAFRLDPHETGNRYCCKFMGAFRLNAFIGENVPDTEYKKVADDFTIGDKGYYNHNVTNKAIFFKNDARYTANIKTLNFSDGVYRMLENAGITMAGELLDMCFGFNQASIELRTKTENFFRRSD